jgi:hypothetical protein
MKLFHLNSRYGIVNLISDLILISHSVVVLFYLHFENIDQVFVSKIVA